MVIYTTIIQIEINNEIIPVHQNNSREKVKWWLVTTVLLLSWFFSSWRFCQCSLKRHHLQHTVGFSCWISHQSRSQLEKVSGRTGICATMWTERAAALSETGVQVWHPHRSSALSRLMKGCEDPPPPPLKKMMRIKRFILDKRLDRLWQTTQSVCIRVCWFRKLFSCSLFLCLQRCCLFYCGKTIRFGL